MSLTTGFISEVLKQKKEIVPQETLTPLGFEFFLAKPLPIKIESYVEHFLYQLDASEELLVIAFSIIQRISNFLSNHTIHRIVFTTLSLSYKFSTDKPARNFQLEKVGGLKTGDLSKLEFALLSLIDWEIHFKEYDTILALLSLANEPEAEWQQGEAKTEVEDFDIDEDVAVYDTNDSFSELSAFFTV